VTSHTVILTDNARKDVEAIYQYYISRINEQLADKLLYEIDKAINLVASKSLLGHLPLALNSTDEDCLEMLTKSFRLIYPIENKNVKILIILHQKQSVMKPASARLLY